MQVLDPSNPPRGLARIYAWPRLRVALIVSLVIYLLLAGNWEASYWVLIGRLLFITLSCLLLFGILERWPPRLPAFVARWVLQIVVVELWIPLAVFISYRTTTGHLEVPFWRDPNHLEGFAFFCIVGLLIAPWIMVTSLLRQIRGEARTQALGFALERSRLERNLLDSRLRLLTAQVEPHFLFNTLANVRELVDSGSPQASQVLGSLISYLRAAVPRLNEPVSTIARELELVRSYLQVMQMRIPDRLQFMIDADPETLSLQCPPMTLLTLVENAVRHGIDPSEEGGRIEVRVERQDDHCRARVIDSGVGLQSGSEGLGTGLETLRERLQLMFGERASLRLSEVQPHGVCAELRFPTQLQDKEATDD